jgi:hypothetical protein
VTSSAGAEVVREVVCVLDEDEDRMGIDMIVRSKKARIIPA